MNRLIPLSVVAALVLFTGVATAQKAKVIGSAHDINTAGCLSCHAPHNGSVATGGTDQTTGRILLWDRAFSAQTFGTYDSPTMDSKATEVGGLPLSATEARMYSMLCMSCHDGVTTPTLIGPTDKHAVGNPTNSAGLTNDHPVNMAYDPTKDTGLAAITAVTTAGLKLYGTTNTMQCASCHNPHDNTISKFLRKSNAGSGLCITCHL